MSPTDPRTARNVYRVLAVTFAGICLIFVVYTIRLFNLARGLRSIGAGEQGVYVGAVVFPLLALSAGWLSVRWFGRARRIRRSQASAAELHR